MTDLHLENCPFCGAVPTWCGDDPDEKHDCHQISCSCGVQLDSTNKAVTDAENLEASKEAMAKLWNTRA